MVWCIYSELEITISSVAVCDNGKFCCYILENNNVFLKDGILSEVSTFSFVLSDRPVVTCEKALFNVENLDEEAVFVVASYCENRLNDVKIIPYLLF